MIRARAIAGLATVAVVATAQAQEIRFAADEIENLGIRFEQLLPAADAAGIETTARVVLPPAGDAVISAPHTGLLTRLAANTGDEVEEGQVLAELGSPDFISLQREFLDAANAQRLARTEYQRDVQLEAEGIVSARRLQETTARKAVADAAVAEHRQLLQFAGMREAEIRDLETRQHLQQSLLIRAPFSGVIAERMAANGERLDPMSPIYRLVDMSELWLDINVPQEQLGLIEPGARVSTIGGAGDSAGVITTIGRAVNPETQSAIARAKLDADSSGLRPGQFVAVRIYAGDTDADGSRVFEVPAAALTRSGQSSYVFVRTANGAQAREVRVVNVSGDRAWIRSDLAADDAVVVAGIAAVKSMWLAGGEGDS